MASRVTIQTDKGPVTMEFPDPYAPPWYPDHGPSHNPFAVATLRGQRYYELWVNALPKGELMRLIRASRENS